MYIHYRLSRMSDTTVTLLSVLSGDVVYGVAGAHTVFDSQEDDEISRYVVAQVTIEVRDNLT